MSIHCAAVTASEPASAPMLAPVHTVSSIYRSTPGQDFKCVFHAFIDAEVLIKNASIKRTHVLVGCCWLGKAST